MSSSSPSSQPPAASSPGDAPEATIDISGEICPFTFVRAKLALEALPIGARLRVITDHEPAARNIPRSAREWGQDVERVAAHGDGRWAIDLVKRVR